MLHDTIDRELHEVTQRRGGASSNARRREPMDSDSHDPDPLWSVVFDGYDPDIEQIRERLLTIGDGTLGSSWSPYPKSRSALPWVAMNGAYTTVDGRETLAVCPIWNRIPHRIPQSDLTSMHRELDMRAGMLRVMMNCDRGRLEAEMFSSQSRPGTVALVAQAPEGLLCEDDPIAPPPASPVIAYDPPILLEREATSTRVGWASLEIRDGRVAAAAVDVWTATHDGRVRLERVGRYEVLSADADVEEWAGRIAAELGALTYDELAEEQVSAWKARWDDADIEVGGGEHIQQAIRFNLYHLMSCVATDGEAAVGARGLSGPNYAGHVFWDTDVFVLPFVAATHPESARAILEYRIRRLPEARRNAERTGYRGVRFPWESAHTGEEVTPDTVVDKHGKRIPVITAEFEQHITADVAWAACQYVAWTGDTEFAETHLPTLLVETARFWASRAVLEKDGRYHIRHVIGPDEYHEDVDDSAYTNAMAAWNLRRAAEIGSADPGERDSWLGIAEGLVTGLDDETGLYEQFAGFFDLEPLIIADVLDRPVAADADLGYDRVKRSQVVKQADVVMLLHVLPELDGPKRVRANIDFYEPRTAHGSSLSPAIHAGLLARIARYDEAIRWLCTSAMLDLDDVTGTAVGGVHTATMGGVWQALVHGFAGVRVEGDSLRVDPRLPPDWSRLSVRVRFRGRRVLLVVSHDGVSLEAEAPVSVLIGDADDPTEIAAAEWVPEALPGRA